MKKISIALLAVPMLLVGCGQANQTDLKHSNPQILVHVHHSTPNKPTNWVSSYSVVKPTEFYVISPSEKVPNVGKLIYKNNGLITHGPGGWATPDKDVVEIWTISGVNISKGVAVKLKDGTYVRANAVGTKQP